MVMRGLVETFLSPQTSLGSPGVDELRWFAPVRPGDQLRTAITVLTNRASRTRTDRGIVISEIAVRNQDDVLVLSMKASIFILRRAA
jgi:acyl dehydratase